MVAYLLQVVENGKDMHVRNGLVGVFKSLNQLLPLIIDNIPVQSVLSFAEITSPDVFNFGRQLFQYLLFFTPQCEGMYQPGQSVFGLRVSIFLYRKPEIGLKNGLCHKVTWQCYIEK